MLSAVLLVAAGCGGHAPSSASITRTWSQALNAGDNEAAARLFAKGAQIYQAGTVTHLRTLADAIRWNATLPCSGHILHIETAGDTTTATFLLGPRKDSPCDAPGATATAQFQVRHGKIVVWRQLVDVGSAV